MIEMKLIEPPTRSQMKPDTSGFLRACTDSTARRSTAPSGGTATRAGTTKFPFAKTEL